MGAIRPFQIDIADSILDRLHKKLALADYPAEPEAGLDYGAS